MQCRSSCPSTSERGSVEEVATILIRGSVASSAASPGASVSTAGSAAAMIDPKQLPGMMIDLKQLPRSSSIVAVDAAAATTTVPVTSTGVASLALSSLLGVIGDGAAVPFRARQRSKASCGK